MSPASPVPSSSGGREVRRFRFPALSVQPMASRNNSLASHNCSLTLMRPWYREQAGFGGGRLSAGFLLTCSVGGIWHVQFVAVACLVTLTKLRSGVNLTCST